MFYRMQRLDGKTLFGKFWEVSWECVSDFVCVLTWGDGRIDIYRNNCYCIDDLINAAYLYSTEMKVLVIKKENQKFCKQTIRSAISRILN